MTTEHSDQTLQMRRARMRIRVVALILLVGTGAILIGRSRGLQQANSPPTVSSQETTPDAKSSEPVPIELFLTLTGDDPSARVRALKQIEAGFDNGETPMLLEAFRFARDEQTRDAIVSLLTRQTGQDFGRDHDKWYKWVWNRDDAPHPEYATFKKQLYRELDPRFAEYFSPGDNKTIRLDEIQWGGVRRDGIPPLKNPERLTATQATFLADSDVVFGVEFGGEAVAYPKRILAWHEMVKDVVGGRSINGVYCTLCGSMIIYDTQFEETHYELGTSGFLYRSNKLMYDHETKSLWSTLKGEPVVGPLVGKGIKLKSLHVVTTTWGKWKTLHPDTTVLSLETGHRRDYGEGVAYRDYFATDQLMFGVPKTDSRLKNKAEVLIIRSGEQIPLAIEAEFLNQHRVYHDSIGELSFVVLTDSTGANRVYESGSLRFDELTDDGEVIDSDGNLFRVTEDELVPLKTESEIKPLPRVSAHRAFWFGLYSAFPETRLVNLEEE